MGKIVVFQNYNVTVKKNVHGSYSSHTSKEMKNSGGAQNCTQNTSTDLH